MPEDVSITREDVVPGLRNLPDGNTSAAGIVSGPHDPRASARRYAGSCAGWEGMVSRSIPEADVAAVRISCSTIADSKRMPPVEMTNLSGIAGWSQRWDRGPLVSCGDRHDTKNASLRRNFATVTACR
ncbi:hypothetical protein CH252_20825 [Rhodococcus sp. 06-1477-1B]|nr:hypothetical protein CH252_20825 [Rhodococcus sp. 06-1477-1B]